jgi:hypothetical protein
MKRAAQVNLGCPFTAGPLRFEAVDFNWCYPRNYGIPGIPVAFFQGLDLQKNMRKMRSNLKRRLYRLISSAGAGARGLTRLVAFAYAARGNPGRPFLRLGFEIAGIRPDAELNRMGLLFVAHALK